MVSLLAVCDTTERHGSRRADRAPRRCRAREERPWRLGRPHRPPFTVQGGKDFDLSHEIRSPSGRIGNPPFNGLRPPSETQARSLQETMPRLLVRPCPYQAAGDRRLVISKYRPNL